MSKKPVKANAPEFFIPASYKGPSLAKVPPNSQQSKANSCRASQDESPTITVTESKSNAELTVGSSSRMDSRKPLLFASPTGTLDLSLYNYSPGQPGPAENKTVVKANGKAETAKLTLKENHVIEVKTDDSIDVETAPGEKGAGEKEPKRSRFRRPRRNSKLDWLIRLLQDKRVSDDGEELEDLQMPKLRKVLNIIFVTLGVCFLLAVIIVILYTSFVNDADTGNPEAQTGESKSTEDGPITGDQLGQSNPDADSQLTFTYRLPFSQGAPVKETDLHTPRDVIIDRYGRLDPMATSSEKDPSHPNQPVDRLYLDNYPSWWSQPYQQLPPPPISRSKNS